MTHDLANLPPNEAGEGGEDLTGSRTEQRLAQRDELLAGVRIERIVSPCSTTEVSEISSPSTDLTVTAIC